MKLLKRRLRSLPYIFIALAVIYMMPPLFVKEIDVTRDAILYTLGDEASAVATTITISGQLHNKQRKKMDEFEGRIMIEGLSFTKAYGLSPLQVYQKEKGMNRSVLFYAKNEKGSILDGTMEIGSIQFDDKFSKIIMWVTQDGERYEVVAEARTLEEALALRQQYELVD